MVAAKGLPAWMYHAQRDPAVFGISWVDLVFPFFLFTMGAAMAFVIDRKVDDGTSKFHILKDLVIRGLMLGVFALIGEHWRPYTMSGSPGPKIWVLSIVGFFAISAMFARWPASIPKNLHRPLTLAGWAVAIGSLPFLHYANGVTGFANYRNDVILMVLANVTVVGGLIYLFTRGNAQRRIIAWLAVALVTLTADKGGIGQFVWDWTPTQYLHLDQWAFGRYFPVFYHFEYCKYLLIALPGTICGEQLMLHPEGVRVTSENSLESWTAAGALLISSVLIPAALLAREIWMAAIALVILSASGRYFIRTIEAAKAGILTEVWNWGAALIGLGLFAEPIGGGIRKDGPTTLSYHLVCAGLAFFAVGGLSILYDGLRQRWLRPVAELGMNPILGYVAITNLITGVAGLTRIEDLYAREDINPWLITAIGLGKTLVVMIVVAWATRQKFFVRA